MVLVKSIFVINLLKLCAIKSRERETHTHTQRHAERHRERQRNVVVHSIFH